MSEESGLGGVSLQAQLVWRLCLVLVVSLVLVVATFVGVTWATLDDVEDVDDVSLYSLARQVAGTIRRDGARVQFDLPDELRDRYAGWADDFLYALLDRDDRAFMASSTRAAELAETNTGAAPARGGLVFSFSDDRAEGYSYEALITRPPGEADVTLFVARRTEFEPESAVEEFSETFVWILPPIMVIALLIAVLTIRRALLPLKALSERAAVIGPGSINIRLPLQGVAKEILPLVAAVNGALERLDRGYHAQRKFAADAAHELRTPLAVLTARLSELPDSATRKDLQDDAHRLERLVSQLLTVARAEGKAFDLDQSVDLYAMAAEVVAFMAPVAVKRGRTIALGGETAQITVKGNPEALWDALRNLLENAVQHAPPNTEVEVIVGADATITVRDAGAGIPQSDRESIFRPFWRGPGDNGPGAGLGLSIVAETVAAHGGTVSVSSAPQGGAEFVVQLPQAPPSSP